MYHMGRQPGQAPMRAPLTELESEIMNAVWEGGACSVEDVHRVVGLRRDLKEDTVRTMLRRLEQKGCLTHSSEGRAYIYRPKESAHLMAARAVRQIIDRFCRGSLDQLVSGMVDGEMVSEAELGKLREYVTGSRPSKAGHK
jgi:predicted transcriptional regulator